VQTASASVDGTITITVHDGSLLETTTGANWFGLRVENAQLALDLERIDGLAMMIAACNIIHDRSIGFGDGFDAIKVKAVHAISPFVIGDKTVIESHSIVGVHTRSHAV